jgi:2-hydroxychromene-2-carboxylate isomerase
VVPRFYFGTISPYSWFAAERLGDLLPDAHWRPVFAGGLFRSAGRVSWGITSERQKRIEECDRRAAAYGLGPVRWPDGWPGNDVLSARAMVVADRNHRLIPFALAAMRACFQEGQDVTQPDVLASLAVAAGLEGAELLEQAAAPANKETLRAINDEAVAAGVIGVPSLVINGEVFWGDDRLTEAVAYARRAESRRQSGSSLDTVQTDQESRSAPR